MTTEPIASDTRICVLDDNRNFQNLMRTLLRAMGFRRVDVFADPAEARAFVTETPVDLAFVDLVMPQQSGIEWVRGARRGATLANPTMAIALVTGWADRRVLDAAVAAGVDDVLVKPLSTTTLHRHTIRLLDHPIAYERGPNGYFGPDLRNGDARLRSGEALAAVAADEARRKAVARRRPPRSVPGLHVEIRDRTSYDAEQTFLD